MTVPEADACTACNGCGWIINGEHAWVCNYCCRHDRGVFALPRRWRPRGVWACRRGCGTVWPNCAAYYFRRGNGRWIPEEPDADI